MKQPEIDELVQNLASSMKQLEAYAQSRINHYQSYRNTIASATLHLPIELLSRILFLSVPVEIWSVDRLHELAQVSRSWRSVVLGTPELWSVAKVHRQPDDDPCWRENLLLALEKSKNQPLRVVYGHTGDSGEWDIKAVEEFMQVMGEHADRWQSIDYTGYYSGAVIAEMERQAPGLETLNVQLWQEEDQDPDHDGLFIHFDTPYIGIIPAARLYEVNLVGALVPWNALTDLVTLKISFILRHSSAPSVIRVTDFLTTLRSCPNLELLHLDDIGYLDDAKEAEERFQGRIVTKIEQIHLPRLTNISLRRIEYALALSIIASLRAESVATLHMVDYARIVQAMPLMDSSLLFGPSLHTAITRSCSLYMQLAHNGLALKSHNGVYIPALGITPIPTFNIRLNYNYTERAVLENLTSFLRIKALAAPLHLLIGNDLIDGDSALYQIPIPFPTRLLWDLTTLKELRLYSQSSNAPSILESLSSPREEEAGELLWACPELEELYVHGAVCPWEKLLSFLLERYGENQRLPKLPPLKLLLLGGLHPTPDELSRVVGVEVVSLV